MALGRTAGAAIPRSLAEPREGCDRFPGDNERASPRLSPVFATNVGSSSWSCPSPRLVSCSRALLHNGVKIRWPGGRGRHRGDAGAPSAGPRAWPARGLHSFRSARFGYARQDGCRFPPILRNLGRKCTTSGAQGWAGARKAQPCGMLPLPGCGQSLSEIALPNRRDQIILNLQMITKR